MIPAFGIIESFVKCLPSVYLKNVNLIKHIYMYKKTVVCKSVSLLPVDNYFLSSTPGAFSVSRSRSGSEERAVLHRGELTNSYVQVHTGWPSREAISPHDLSALQEYFVVFNCLHAFYHSHIFLFCFQFIFFKNLFINFYKIKTLVHDLRYTNFFYFHNFLKNGLLTFKRLYILK